MIFDSDSVGILGDLFSTPAKGCKHCHEERGLDVEMEPTAVWHRTLAAYVDAWECPECGRQVMRDEGDGVGITTPGGERF